MVESFKKDCKVLLKLRGSILEKILKIYSDGACKGNPGKGGWGAVLIWGKTEKKLKGYSEHTTNNAMELIAAIEGIKAVNKKVKIEIYTDSKYVKDGIEKWLANWKKNGWKNSRKTEIKNLKLWQELAKTVEEHTVSWHWVKGHSGDKYNEIADALANEAIVEANLEENQLKMSKLGARN